VDRNDYWLAESFDLISASVWLRMRCFSPLSHLAELSRFGSGDERGPAPMTHNAITAGSLFGRSIDANDASGTP